jgi:ubiquinone/menaquinone biosynthesis C-methylase UbiE
VRGRPGTKLSAARVGNDGASTARWYQRMAPIYNLSCRPLYAGPRRASLAALDLHGGEVVLDLCCGTGLNLPGIAAQIGTAGQLVGVDFSPEMLTLAESRRKLCPAPLELVRADARELELERWLVRSPRRPDAVICSFGLAVTPDWQAVFERSFDLLLPGGRYVIVDNQPLPRGWRRALNPALVPLSNWAGHAEIRRDTAGLLLGLPGASQSQHLGGYVHVTAASKPATTGSFAGSP